MYVKKSIDTWEELKNNSWSGAIDRLNIIEENNMEDEFLEHLEEVFCEETPTETELNDYIWFEDDYYMELLGLNEEDENE